LLGFFLVRRHERAPFGIFLGVFEGWRHAGAVLSLVRSTDGLATMGRAWVGSPSEPFERYAIGQAVAFKGI
jgi:hypothetical protein